MSADIDATEAAQVYGDAGLLSRADAVDLAHDMLDDVAGADALAAAVIAELERAGMPLSRLRDLHPDEWRTLVERAERRRRWVVRDGAGHECSHLHATRRTAERCQARLAESVTGAWAVREVYP